MQYCCWNRSYTFHQLDSVFVGSDTASWLGTKTDFRGKILICSQTIHSIYLILHIYIWEPHGVAFALALYFILQFWYDRLWLLLDLNPFPPNFFLLIRRNFDWSALNAWKLWILRLLKPTSLNLGIGAVSLNICERYYSSPWMFPTLHFSSGFLFLVIKLFRGCYLPPCSLITILATSLKMC